ncbi:AsmA family protein [Pseudorhodobacter sp. W20_MBD10_FR17]|uniref:AsmA family protein n=1 Tax=Pseudorhodobacter sp. W20_MBD10_FR17 TaxID=3240266 RepID=UPI003F9B8BE5
MRWFVRIGFGLVMLVVVLAGLVFLIPAAKVADVAAAQFLKTTGRAMTVEGGASPTIWPVLGVKTGLVQIANADWSREGPLLQAEGLAIGLDVAALIGGDIKITQIEAIRPQIILERNTDGLGNWEIASVADLRSSGTNTASTSETAKSSVITLDHGVIEDGSVLFLDHANGSRMEIRNIAAEARMPDFSGPATLSLSGVKDGVKLALEGQVAAFDAFAAGKVTDVALKAAIGGSKVDFNGRLGLAPMLAEGAVVADLADLAAVMGLAGQAAPTLPQGLGAKTRQVSGTLTLTNAGSMHLRGGSVVLDGNRFTGDLDAVFEGDRPNVTAKISAGSLNFTSPVSASSATAAQGTAPAGWSRDLIDVSGLAALDARLTLSADQIDLGTAKLDRTRLYVTLDKSRMVIESQELRAYGGNVTGSFVVNGRDGMSVGGDLRATGVAMQPLLQDVAKFDRLIGNGDLNLKFLGIGNRLSDIMNSLSGTGSLRFGKGELRGLDLVGMLKSLDLGYIGEGQKTIFDAITASFSIQGGVLRNDDLQFKSAYITASGSGQVGIGARDLNYRLMTTALAQTDGTGGITVPLIISGPWAQPKFRLDMQALLDQNLAEEKERLKQKARAEEDRAKAKLEKELGIQRLEGEKLEDAAKRRAQEAIQAEAARALGKLFGAN